MSNNAITLTGVEGFMDFIFCSIASAISLYLIMSPAGLEMSPDVFGIVLLTSAALGMVLSIFFVLLHYFTHVSILQTLAASFALLLIDGMVYFFDVSFTGRSIVLLILIWLGFMMGPSVVGTVRLHMERTSGSRGIKCVKCGYVNRRKSNYCSKCGADLTDGTKVYTKK